MDVEVRRIIWLLNSDQGLIDGLFAKLDQLPAIWGAALMRISRMFVRGN